MPGSEGFSLEQEEHYDNVFSGCDCSGASFEGVVGLSIIKKSNITDATFPKYSGIIISQCDTHPGPFAKIVRAFQVALGLPTTSPTSPKTDTARPAQGSGLTQDS